MAAKQSDRTKDPVNYVHQSSILCETVAKENRCHRIFTTYGINPFRKIHVLPGKPNSPYDTAEGEEDPQFLKIIERAHHEPVKKYDYPQTESQEYGWITKPLIEHDLTDKRLNFHRQYTSITKYMDAAWRMEEKNEKETAK